MKDHLFAGGTLQDFLAARQEELRREVEAFDRNYLLNVGETQLCDHLVSKYTLEAPTLRADEIVVEDESEVDIDMNRDPPRMVFDRFLPEYVKGTAVTIAVPFNGTPSLFSYRPSTFAISGPSAGKVVNDELRLTYRVLDHNKEQLRRSYDTDFRSIVEYLGWIRQDIEAFVRSLRPMIEQLVRERKQRLLANAGLAASLGVPIRRREGATGTYTPPEIRRKPHIERPSVPRGSFEPEPALAQAEYDHILEILERSTGTMERSPSAFAAMGEEDIRWQLLLHLNGHYEVQGAAEAFNYKGKTDILLPYQGRAVFIAECKFWGGPKLFIETLDQLLSYTSWRDTKTAAIVFNRIKDHTGVIEKVASSVPNHPCFIRELGRRGETHFRYLFRHPADANRELYVAVLVFHVPQQP